MLRSTKGDNDGPMQLLLEAPEAAAAGPQSEALVLVKLPQMVAAEVHLRCADSWEALRARKHVIYRRLESAGFRLTGEERNVVLVPRARKDCRYWRLLIGVRKRSPRRRQA